MIPAHEAFWIRMYCKRFKVKLDLNRKENKILFQTFLVILDGNCCVASLPGLFLDRLNVFDDCGDSFSVTDKQLKTFKK